ncbi:hypothetical protein BKP45_05120 [Anaerobacillus alkalidiazotrophicus]|uniref:Uncharacterized protein n=1 Tax=Anaerobacillus alkalidiazotrophicus TaxID=472963 RepID=A0A1S2MBK2_9BACI|nr:hypothetical protein [Anaerobacillus alkalidiazotrophicus]OIJ22059.1 hypothetical protein BKP45_05120 [Anaerobacillus alkalidiazotrophicus]
MKKSVDPKELYPLVRTYRRCKFILSEAIRNDNDILKSYYSKETKRLERKIFNKYGIIVD